MTDAPRLLRPHRHRWIRLETVTVNDVRIPSNPHTGCALCDLVRLEPPKRRKP